MTAALTSPRVEEGSTFTMGKFVEGDLVMVVATIPDRDENLIGIKGKIIRPSTLSLCNPTSNIYYMVALISEHFDRIMEERELKLIDRMSNEPHL